MSGYVLKRVTQPSSEISALIEQHNAMMRAATPAKSCHVLTSQEMFDSGMQVFSLATAKGGVLAIGALKALDSAHVELKSMHTRSNVRGQGVGAALLTALRTEATRYGYRRISLETGSGTGFAAARRLYARHGFEVCDPFGPYISDPLSVFMTRCL